MLLENVNQEAMPKRIFKKRARAGLQVKRNVMSTRYRARRESIMKIEKNPFSFYDFLGYFIPGVTSIYCIYYIISCYSLIDIRNVESIKNLQEYLILIIVAYIIGHLLSYLSSVSIEVYSIWSLGYPSKYLLGFPFRGFWHNLLKEKRIITKIAKLIMCLYILPIVVTDVFIRKIFRFRQLLGKPLDSLTASIIKTEIKKKMIMETSEDLRKENTDDQDFFRIIYHVTMEKCPAHNVKLDNYVALYGFTRTLSFVFATLFWVLTLIIIFNGYSKSALCYAIASFIIAGLLYLDFNKFYRKFSLEAFMGFISIGKET